jgi:hypothetical protein
MMLTLRSLFSSICILLLSTPIQAQQLKELWTSDTSLRTPESVLYHEADQILYVSNIDGGPWEDDKKGFISKLNLDGSIESLHWITGLSAPKGLCLVGDQLFVADINRLVQIDIRRGQIMKIIPVEGSEGLNDVSADAKGMVYVTDSKTKKVHRFDTKKGHIETIHTSLQGPNGILALPSQTFILDGGQLKVQQGKSELVTLGMIGNGADGIEAIDATNYIVSCWPGEVYHISLKPTVQATLLLDTKNQKLNAADIGYDPKKKIVYLPTFFGNTVVAYAFVISE